MSWAGLCCPHSFCKASVSLEYLFSHQWQAAKMKEDNCFRFKLPSTLTIKPHDTFQICHASSKHLTCKTPCDCCGFQHIDWVCIDPTLFFSTPTAPHGQYLTFSAVIHTVCQDIQTSGTVLILVRQAFDIVLRVFALQPCHPRNRS